jgi:hypothetical protein
MRVRAIAKKDANVNAIIELVNLTFLVSRSLDSDLDDLKPVFT